MCWFRDKGPPVVEEGTDNLGSDRVELQVRDMVEVLLAGFQEEGAGKESTSQTACSTTYQTSFYPEQQAPREKLRGKRLEFAACLPPPPACGPAGAGVTWRLSSTFSNPINTWMFTSRKMQGHLICTLVWGSETTSGPPQTPDGETLLWPVWSWNSRMLAWRLRKQSGRSSKSET